MFDIFYIGPKPGLFKHEIQCRDIDHAQRLSRTRFFWIIDYLCDYRGFDFIWEPPPWQAQHRHAWASQWQPDSGTYLIPKLGFTNTNYHRDPVILRIPNLDPWIVPDNIDRTQFDWSWHPDSNEPNFEFHFGTQWQKTGGPIYAGSAGIKICDQQRAIAIINSDNWYIPNYIDADSVDMSWHPNPLDPPYIYHFPDQHQPVSGVTYTVPGARDIKMVQPFQVKATRQSMDHWSVPDWIDPDSIDYTWHPNPLDPPYIYHFSDQWQTRSGVIYTCPSSVGEKTVTTFQCRAMPRSDHWHIPDWIDRDSVDISWHPDATDPPYIYHFDAGRGWGNVGGVEYFVPGAEQRKNFDCLQYRTRSRDSWWYIPDWIDPDSIDRSWVPNPESPPYIYEFPVEWGWDRVGGPQYCVPGADSIKYETAFCARTRPGLELIQMDQISEDSSVRRWRPNPSDPPYIYVFGNQWWPAEKRASAEYHMPGATERKYMSAPRACRLHDRTNFKILIDSEFDWSWEPDPGDPPYIYVFGNQWWSAEKMPTVEYHVPGATERKYISAPRAELPQRDDTGWQALKPCEWDHSWVPDPGDPPYIYVFGNQWWSAEKMPTVEYHVPGATERKYVSTLRASLLPDPALWCVPDGIDPNSVDYSWQPDPGSLPYIYHFPSQHQPVSGVTYTVPGARDIKILAEPRVMSLSRQDQWYTPSNIAGFDYSWHPNPLDPPYVHEFGTQWYDEGGPIYAMPGAQEKKYHDVPRATLSAGSDNWHRLFDIDEGSFDWSWRPHPRDPAYIYVWGNQHWSAEKMPTLEYRVPGATERKYMPSGPRLAPCRENWSIPDDIDETTVDYTWRPDPGDAAYIYEFATQWQKNGGARYVVPGAREHKYVDIIHLRRPARDHHWQVLEDIDEFDFSWHPDSTEPPYIYVFGNQHYPGTIMPTIRYHVPGATQEKFLDSPRARLSPSRKDWEIQEPIDEEIWDWTWRPDPTEPPYIYIFGNQWNPAEHRASLRYVVPGAEQVKYMEPRTRRLPDPSRFRCNLAVRDFDWSWEPNPFDPPMIYVFGNQWNPAVLEPTVIYSTGGSEIKYMDLPVASLASDTTDWSLLDDIESFDYSWRPNPRDPPYIYVFGNQWLAPQQRPALEYHVSGATERKYMTEPRACRAKKPQDFVTLHDCDFDFSWEPDPGSPPYIYVFGNQWWPAEIMPTVEYHVPGATERKYMNEPVTQLRSSDTGWCVTTAHPFEFDRSWCPDPGSPPYIYVFGNQWWPAEQMSTIEYHMPGATERKFMSTPLARILPNRNLWSVPEEVDEHMIDYSWIPDPQEPPYIYHFGTDYQISVGLTYTVPDAQNFKFAGAPPLLTKEKPVIKTLDIFYMDRSNAMSGRRFRHLKERYPDIQKIRYVNSVMDTVSRCLDKTQGTRFWVISSENDYTDFDFAWHAQPWQSSMTHVFGSQWNKWSDTFLINRWEFERHAKWASDIKDFPNLNFVQDQKTTAPADACDIYMIDFDNTESPQTLDFLKGRYRVVKTARYVDNYLDTLRRLLQDIESDHIWVVGSVCDYTRFDFSWQPEAWQRDMLHVFASNDQKFGDTFYVPVRALREKINTLELLDWFDTVNYCDDQGVDRWPMPVIVNDLDSHVDVVKHSSFPGPLAVFTTTPGIDTKKMPTVSLWREKTKTIIPLSNDAGTTIIPKASIPYIKSQLYDYPYIDKSYQKNIQPILQDIIFISYDEPQSEKNWEDCKFRFPRAKRVHGISGMENALIAAAKISNTPWFFAIFAKTEIAEKFDFSFVPDYLQSPKHYVFDCQNLMNGLIYGHMGVIMYNQKFVLLEKSYQELDIDYTLSFPHQIVPILSCYGRFNSSPYHTWRTAFRECAKLALYQSRESSVETDYRLTTWTSNATGDYAEWCLRGANDGVEFFRECAGNLFTLKQSFNWEWLRQRFTNRYGDID